MTAAPSLAKQIEAVEWAEELIAALCGAHLGLGEEIEIALRGLNAAAETMKTWEFARETLK